MFEGEIPGDPDYALTIRAFEAIGCQESANAIRETLALFPDSCPPRDVSERLEHYLSRIPGWPTPSDEVFFDRDDDVMQRLAQFIRARTQAFARLDDPPNARKRSSTERDAAQSRPYVLSELPHWARVAFAAHCEAEVFRLFAEHWPNARHDRSAAIERAIRLAKESAANARPAEGLADVALEAIVVAGAALMAGYGFDSEEPVPENALAATIASSAAKAAEFAAKCAKADAEESVELASQAYSFAASTANSAHAPEICELLAEDLATLRAVAAQRERTDDTPVDLDALRNLDA